VAGRQLAGCNSQDWTGRAWAKLACGWWPAVVLATCHFAGRFYWSSASVPNRRAGRLVEELRDWLPPYLVTTDYVAIAACRLRLR
jgi:hypothetical protein